MFVLSISEPRKGGAPARPAACSSMGSSTARGQQESNGTAGAPLGCCDFLHHVSHLCFRNIKLLLELLTVSVN